MRQLGLMPGVQFNDLGLQEGYVNNGCQDIGKESSEQGK